MKKLELLIHLYTKAVKKHGDKITPCNSITWGSSMDEYGLWYNTPDNSTHLVLSPEYEKKLK